MPLAGRNNARFVFIVIHPVCLDVGATLMRSRSLVVNILYFCIIIVQMQIDNALRVRSFDPFMVFGRRCQPVSMKPGSIRHSWTTK